MQQDGVIKTVKSQGDGCFIRHVCINIILYADDILLLSPSVECLQHLIFICETAINSLGLSLNYRKSVCCVWDLVTRFIVLRLKQ